MDRKVLMAGLLSSAALWSVPSFAQEATTGSSGTPPVTNPQSAYEAADDIVVTAQKRASNIQSTPLAMNALSGDDLGKRQINSIEALGAALPNVNIGKNVGFARIAIRGLGFDSTAPAQEGRVAYHLDGVYISRPSAAIGTFFDVDRIEVVRGPQGTLYGRNATAGAVNVITNDPTPDVSGYGRFTVGNYGLFTEEAAIGGPVSSTLGARFAIQKVNRNGYGKDLITGAEADNENTISVRAKLRWQPGNVFDLTLSADYRREDDHNYLYHYVGDGKPGVLTAGQRLGGHFAANPRDSNEETPTINDRTFYGFGAVANIDLGFAKLTSVTGYRSSKTIYNSDIDSTEAVVTRYNLFEKSRHFSEEIRLSGDFGGRGDWLVGGYYFGERLFGYFNFSPVNRAAVVPTLPQSLAQGFYLGGNLDTDAYAVFGQARYEIVPNLSLSVGARYSTERKRIDENATGLVLTRNYDPANQPILTQFQKSSVRDNSFTPRVSLEYKIGANKLIYATYAKGFKSGGYNLGSIVPPFAPEKLTDYEAGVKADWLDGALRTNVSAFYYDYTNLQVQKVFGTVLQVVNAASATVKGVEVDFRVRPVAGFQIDGNFALLDSKYRNFQTADPARAELGVLDLSGNRLSQAPSYSVNLGVQYALPISAGDITFRAEGLWVDKVYFSPFNRNVTSQPAHSKFNAFVTLDLKSGLSVQLFVRNIADKLIISSAQVSSGLWGFPVPGAFEPPRTFGATLGYKF